MRPLACLPALLLLGACAVYRPPVYQGHLIEERQFEQLRPGMSRRQVELILGAPVARSPFHPDRWDYLAVVRTGRGEPEVRNLTLHFQGGALVRIEGDRFPVDNKALLGAVRHFGNLPKEKDKDRQRRQR
ncbi:MAG: outer membrane protein assembly factor BamE [Xanthomonadales bacterium]|nr:outer membrane protein assembly factor BamE [Xanthomonadales bacterium]